MVKHSSFPNHQAFLLLISLDSLEYYYYHYYFECSVHTLVHGGCRSAIFVRGRVLQVFFGTRAESQDFGGSSGSAEPVSPEPRFSQSC